MNIFILNNSYLIGGINILLVMMIQKLLNSVLYHKQCYIVLGSLQNMEFLWWLLIMKWNYTRSESCTQLPGNSHGKTVWSHQFLELFCLETVNGYVFQMCYFLFLGCFCASELMILSHSARFVHFCDCCGTCES